jgi:hypothetical protein
LSIALSFSHSRSISLSKISRLQYSRASRATLSLGKQAWNKVSESFNNALCINRHPTTTPNKARRPRMSSDTESGGQRPMLASQRKDTSSDANKTGKPAYFPLGYKEGFSQWVCSSL